MKFIGNSEFVYTTNTTNILSAVCLYLRHKWNMASQALICDKKALPSPCPSEAPLTRPAISTTLRKAGTLLKKKRNNIKKKFQYYTFGTYIKSCYNNNNQIFPTFFQMCIWSRNWFLVEHLYTEREYSFSMLIFFTF